MERMFGALMEVKRSDMKGRRRRSGGGGDGDALGGGEGNNKQRVRISLYVSQASVGETRNGMMSCPTSINRT